MANTYNMIGLPSATYRTAQVRVRHALSLAAVVLAGALFQVSAPSPARAAAPHIVLPIEILGPAGTTQTVSLTVPTGTPQVTGLWMQIHGLSYADKASVQVNGGAWVPLDNATVQVASPGKNFGGIGGAFTTLTMTLPVSKVPSGPNTVSFRFNGTDGVSMGFRVLALNFVTASGAMAVSSAQFTQDDPSTWQPPINSPQAIAAGNALWHTAQLVESPLPGARAIKAACQDCHTRDGRDLKYFNYSSNSIIQRAVFHHLSTLQGQEIASYIRSLQVPNPGRPWNPPYQPGPGLDAQPVTNWSAGAGLQWVLNSDSEMLPYLFPHGISDAEPNIQTSATLDLREIPIAEQLPDWNHWLPRVHPKDAWGAAFMSSNLLKDYDGSGTGTSTWNVRSYLESTPPARTLFALGASNYVTLWLQDLTRFVNNVAWPAIPAANTAAWTTAAGTAVYSISQWHMVKEWEVMHEFNLEGLQTTLHPEYGESRAWFVNSAVYTSPHTLMIPADNRGIGGSQLTNTYFAGAWYYIQALLNTGARAAIPVPWSYVYDFIGQTSQMTGQPEPIRQVACVVKAMQNGSNGYLYGLGSPGLSLIGWEATQDQSIAPVVGPYSPYVWAGVPQNVSSQTMSAVLNVWLKQSQAFRLSEWTASGYVNPTYVPVDGIANLNLGDQVWAMIPRFRSHGVDAPTLRLVADWAATLWPNADWASR